MSFTLGNPTGGALTAANTATGDRFPVVDVDVGASDTANKYMTAAELRKLMGRLRPDGVVKTPPLAADIGSTWSWVNQGSASASQNSTGGELEFIAPRTASDNWVMLVKTLPATPLTFTVEFDFEAPISGGTAMGIVYRESGTGEITTVAITSDSGRFSIGGLGMFSANWNSATSYNAQTTSLCDDFALPNLPKALRFSDNGTTLTSFLSWDGLNFTQLGSGVARTSFLTANQIGFCINNKGDDFQLTPAIMMRVRDVY